MKSRLLIVTTTFPRWESDPGPAPFVFDLALHLSKYFEITVLAPHHKGAVEHEVWKGLEIFRFRYLPLKWQTLADGQGIQNHLRSGWRERLKALPLLWSEYRAGKRILKARKFDAINSNWLIPSGLLFARLAGIYATRHIVTVHAADYFMLQRIPFGKSLIRYIARHSQALIPVNEKMAAGIKEIAPGTKVLVMPMGFDPEKFRQVDQQEVEKEREGLGVRNKKVVLFVGKLTEKKGVDNLLEAMKILEKDINNCHLLIVGRGVWKAHLERQASKLDVMCRVKFLGAIPHEKIPLYYHLADVIAIPSVPDRHGESEGMPVVLLEGLASGKPVVGTAFCSAPGPLKEGGGFFETADASPQALAQELKKVLMGEGVADFSKVDQFRWPEVARFYAEVISNA